MLDFLDKAFPEKRESYRINNLFNVATLWNFDIDHLWSGIIADVVETDRLRNFPEYSHLQPEAPFIQGDNPNDPKQLPDVIYLGKDYVMGIECFDFDSSKIKKGSLMRRENNAAHKKLEA